MSENKYLPGNWIMFNDNPFPHLFIPEYYSQLKNVKPILLTEWWLRKGNFYSKEKNTFFNKYIGVILNPDSVGVYIIDQQASHSLWTHISAKCKYVHSMQNLHFDLADQELTFTL